MTVLAGSQARGASVPSWASQMLKWDRVREEHGLKRSVYANSGQAAPHHVSQASQRLCHLSQPPTLPQALMPSQCLQECHHPRAPSPLGEALRGVELERCDSWGLPVEVFFLKGFVSCADCS